MKTKKFSLCPWLTFALLAVFLTSNPLSGTPTDAGKFDLSARASVIDPRAKAHPEIDFLLEKGGKPQDLEHASVDTRIRSQGRLVIWLMGYNKDLFDHLSSYGLNSIQVHYANGWFGKLYSGPPPQDDLFLSKIRLEAATGEDTSKALDIPKPDSIMERAYQFVKWLDRENPKADGNNSSPPVALASNGTRSFYQAFPTDPPRPHAWPNKSKSPAW